MKKITTITLSLAIMLIVTISGITQINQKTKELRRERDGIEYRIMVLKNGQKSPENPANMTIVNKAIPKQAIAL